METVTHSYLTKLRIISKIPENGKLDTTQNDINIYYGTLINWAWRKFQGDSKIASVKYLTDLYREVNSFSDQLMQNIIIESNELRQNKKMVMLVSLSEKIKESLTGIRHLSGTYKDYLKIVSQLECLEQDIIIPQYRILKQFIPELFHTDILQNPLTYAHNHISAGIVNTYDRTISTNSPSHASPIRTMGKPHLDNMKSVTQLKQDLSDVSPSAVSHPIEIKKDKKLSF